MRKFILGLALVLCSFLLTVVFVFNKNYVVPILMYHSIRPDAVPQDRLTVTVESFEHQMRFLREHNYNLVHLEDLVTLIKDKKKIPPRTVAITLDDGNIDNYVYAFGVLKKYNIPATIFVIVNEVERPQGDKLTWEQIKTMHDSGIISVGSHCLGPDPLINIESQEQLRREIFASKRQLEAFLAEEVSLFSYPEGRFNPKIRQLVIDAGYKLAVATNPGKMIPNHDLYALKRIRISASSDNLFVFWLESSGFYNFIRDYPFSIVRLII